METAGKFISFNPGPSQLYAEIEADIRQALEENILSVSHRSEKFGEVVQRTKNHLRTYFSIPADYRIFFVSSAVEAMEIALRSCCGQKSFHFVNGAFARRFFSSAQNVKKNPAHITAEEGKSFSPEGAKIPADCDLVCITQNETSTGVRLLCDFIEKIRKAHPDKLLAADIVSSAGTERVLFDLADFWFFSVQKGCGLPAGLGVIIASKRALTKTRVLAARGTDIGSHHSLLSLDEFGQKNQTPATPNMLAIYLLGKRFERLIKTGLEAVEKETLEKAKTLYHWLDYHAALKPFVKNSADRSFTVIPILLPEGKSSKFVQDGLKSKNLAVGYGYGSFKETQIRLANFPQHSMEDVRRLTETLDSILKL
ncbi:MAG: aminotransferase class V-fold PLP-dependent enzyme [candidate division Zixibacteria bacterium]|nr:aminotransferase class V-fold PLP-dependent enzyme [candidate division Zixibacteria bacterium]